MEDGAFFLAMTPARYLCGDEESAGPRIERHYAKGHSAIANLVIYDSSGAVEDYGPRAGALDFIRSSGAPTS